MTEEQKAAALAAWLDGPPGAPLPEGLDEEVLSAVLTLRPDRAPGPTLALDAILADVREGPFATENVRDAGADVIAFPTAPAAPASSRGAPARRARPWWLGAGLGVALAAAAAAVVVLPQYGREQGASVDPLAVDRARREADTLEKSAAPVVAEALPAAPPGAAAVPATGATPDAVGELSGDLGTIGGGYGEDNVGRIQGGLRRSAGNGEGVGGGRARSDMPDEGVAAATPAPASAARAPGGSGGYGSGAGVSGTSGGPWRTGDGAWPAPESNRAPAPAVGSTPVAGSLEEAPARTYTQEGRAVPELDEEIPADLAAAPAPPPSTAAPVAAKAEAARVEAVAERKKGRAAAPAAKEAADAEREDSGPTDAELRQAALPRGYVATWWQSTPEVAVVYGRAESTSDPRAAAELYLTLAGDSRTLVAQDAAWRAAKRLQSVDPARALAVAQAGLARGGAGTPFRANLVVLTGDLLLAAGRRDEAIATWRTR